MSASKIIEYLLKFRPSTKWIVEESKLPYLPLELDVPTEDIYNEWQTIKDQAVIHRGGDNYGTTQNVGWKSLTLYGVNSQETSKVSDTMDWTEIAQHCPLTVGWIKNNFVIDERTGRIRFMLLEPGGFIVLHRDREYTKLSEVNIAVTNPNGCVFRFKNHGTVPFKPGQTNLMDISYEHFVVNNSTEPRLHIIVHSKLKDESVISRSYANRYYS